LNVPSIRLSFFVVVVVVVVGVEGAMSDGSTVVVVIVMTPLPFIRPFRRAPLYFIFVPF